MTGVNGQGHTIFVVDDESVIASTIAIILTQNGYKATSFTNPEAALAACDGDAKRALSSP